MAAKNANGILEKAGYKILLGIIKNSTPSLLKVSKHKVVFYVNVDFQIPVELTGVKTHNISEIKDCKITEYDVGYEIAGLIYEMDNSMCICNFGNDGIPKLKNHSFNSSSKEVFPMVNLSMVRDDHSKVDEFVDKAIKRIRNQNIDRSFDDIKRLISHMDNIKHKLEISLDKKIEESYFKVQDSLPSGDAKLIEFISALMKITPCIQKAVEIDTLVDTVINELGSI